MYNILSSSAEILSSFEDIFYWTGTHGTRTTIEDIFGNTMFTGYTCEEIKSKPSQLLSIICPDDLSPYKKAFNAFLLEGKGEKFSWNYRLIAKNNDLIWVKEEIVLKKDPGSKNIYLTAVLHNINSYQRKVEDLQQKYDHLSQLNNSKDKFISILSHDLRAPFTSILGFSEILMNDKALSENERAEYLNYIHESSQTQLQLINYLLDWSRLQTGRMKIEPHRLNAQKIIYNAVSALTGNAIRKSIEIRVFIHESIFIEADERLITQVVTNLLSNAIKFSPENKKVEVRADIFNDYFVEFVVKDEGVGIPETNKEKIFKVEKMFSSEGTKGEKGTGLGLSVVKEIVEKHNGRIWFYSSQETGSEFHFTLPASKSSILVVENDMMTMNLISDNLKGHYPEFEIALAINGYEAMNIISNKRPSLIISGHELPFMSGVQLLKSIRSNEKEHNVPFIAVIEDITDDMRRSYYEYGINSLLRKPLDMYAFHREIDSVLS